MRHYLYTLMTDQRHDPLTALAQKVLSLFAVLYRFLLALRQTLWRTGLLKKKHLPLKVISVGNITVGGTGKTPFVKWLVRRLLSQGKRIAVLSQGYQRLAKDLSDEALELRKSFPDVPVWIGKDRVKLAEKALKAEMEAVILDDGFQYWRLKRDLDIVLIDATNPFGNGELLPRGLLRERPSDLMRADLLILTRADDGKEELDRLERLLSLCAPDCPILFSSDRVRCFYEARTGEAISPEVLRNGKVIPFCGIGNPRAFQRLLERCGLSVLQPVFFMDHHRYRKEDLRKLDESAQASGAAYLLTTEKDAERLNALGLRPSTRLAVVEVELVVTKNEDELLHRLNRLFPR